MVTGLRRLVDGAVGETREALLEDGRAVAFRVWRWSDEGRRARWGERYCARVMKVDTQRRGAFLDLGLGLEQGFFPLGRVAPEGLREGAFVLADIAREAARGKSPLVSLAGTAPSGPPRRLETAEIDVDLAAARPASMEDRERIDAIQDAVLDQTVGLPGGGAIRLEPTAALVAIDVDAEGRSGSRDPERFALDLNLEAGAVALARLRLTQMGGLCAIDFVNMRRPESRAALEAAMKAAAARDSWGVQLARLSRFGVMEVQRGQLCRPLWEDLRDRSGQLSCETMALGALRRLETEANRSKGRIVELRAASDVVAWLEANHIPWRPALEARIGHRWSLLAEAGMARERLEVRVL